MGTDGRLYAIGGGNADDYDLPTNGAHGPNVNLSPNSGHAGSMSVLSGTNFAPNATVRVYWGTAITGTFLLTGTTNSVGTLTSGLSFTAPTTATVNTRVTAVDDRSWYPVNALFTVN